jgi:uncharacterized RDD family membrane protein YckC
MTSTLLRTALLCLSAIAATAPTTSAQDTTPQTPPPVEAPDRETVRRRSDEYAVRFLEDYTLRRGEAVREVQVLIGDAVIEGQVDYDVVVIMGSARLGETAVIGGSLVVVGGSGRIDSGARIGRDLVVVGGTLEAPPGFAPDGKRVVVGAPWFGHVLRDVSPWLTRGLLWGRLIVPELEWVWLVVAGFFLVYLALNTVFDRAIGATADVLADRPLSAFVGGLLVLVLAVPVLVIIAATVIGMPVIPFLACGLIVAALIGKTAVARAMGRSIIRTGTPEGRIAALVAFLIGFALLVFAYMVPILGLVTWALTGVLGLGAATTMLRTHLRRERKASTPTPPPAVAPAAVPVASASDVRPELSPPAPAPAAPPAPALPPIPPPAPAFTQGLAQYPRATFLDRLAAFVLDCILVAIANGLLDMRNNDGFFFILLLAYHVAFWAWRGTTLGGIICSLRVTRTDGTDLRPVDAVVRGLSGIFSIAALGIGCLWMLQDSESQMWHDKIAGTLVVKVPREVVLP